MQAHHIGFQGGDYNTPSRRTLWLINRMLHVAFSIDKHLYTYVDIVSSNVTFSHSLSHSKGAYVNFKQSRV